MSKRLCWSQILMKCSICNITLNGHGITNKAVIMAKRMWGTDFPKILYLYIVLMYELEIQIQLRKLY